MAGKKWNAISTNQELGKVGHRNAIEAFQSSFFFNFTDLVDDRLKWC